MPHHVTIRNPAQYPAQSLPGTTNSAIVGEPSAAVAPGITQSPNPFNAYPRSPGRLADCLRHRSASDLLPRGCPMGRGHRRLHHGRSAPPGSNPAHRRPLPSRHWPAPWPDSLPRAEAPEVNGPILPGERIAAIRALPVPPPTGATLPTLPPSPSRDLPT